jgi:hypothetical protein
MGNYLDDKQIGVHAKLDINGIVTQQKYWYYLYLFLHQFIIFEYLIYWLLIYIPRVKTQVFPFF